MVPPREADPTLPMGLDAVVMEALAARPDERYSSAGAFQAAIEDYAAANRLPLSSRALSECLRELAEVPRPAHASESTVRVDEPGSITAPAIETTTQAVGSRRRPDARRDRTPGPTVIAAGVALAAFVGWIGASAIGSGPSPGKPDPAAAISGTPAGATQPGFPLVLETVQTTAPLRATTPAPVVVAQGPRVIALPIGRASGTHPRPAVPVRRDERHRADFRRSRDDRVEGT